MTLYEELLAKLNSAAEEKYRIFHSSLLGKGNFKVLGVRVPVLRKIAKNYFSRINEVLALPDEFYEVKFIKLACAAQLSYGELVKVIDYCVGLIDNWALCDCFAPACIRERRQDFLKYVNKFFNDGGEFTQRFALTALLHFYVEEEYLGLIFQKTASAGNEKYYYVRMASAWLIAEVLVKHYGRGVEFLKRGLLDKKTHNKAITKALESFRINDERKNYLRSIKR